MMNWWRNAVIVLRLWLSQCCLFEWICIDKMMVTGVYRSKTENYNAKMLFHKQKDSVGHWQRQWILINKRTSGIKVYEKCSFIIMIRSKQYLRLNEAPMKNKLNTRILKQQQQKKKRFLYFSISAFDPIEFHSTVSCYRSHWFLFINAQQAALLLVSIQTYKANTMNIALEREAWLRA